MKAKLLLFVLIIFCFTSLIKTDTNENSEFLSITEESNTSETENNIVENNENTKNTQENVENTSTEVSNDLSYEYINSSSVQNNEDEEDVGEIPTDKSDVKLNDDEEDVGEIPTDKSDVKLNDEASPEGSGENPDKEKKEITYDDYDPEDNIAKYAFLLILCFLVVFLLLFIYNLLKCYYKSPNNQGRREYENESYSRELGHINDDSVLDLPH